MSTELELASWRRMTSELQTAARSEDDPQRGHALWQRGRDELLRSQSRQRWRTPAIMTSKAV